MYVDTQGGNVRISVDDRRVTSCRGEALLATVSLLRADHLSSRVSDNTLTALLPSKHFVLSSVLLWIWSRAGARQV